MDQVTFTGIPELIFTAGKQTLCPRCKIPFSTNNPPRSLKPEIIRNSNGIPVGGIDPLASHQCRQCYCKFNMTITTPDEEPTPDKKTDQCPHCKGPLNKRTPPILCEEKETEIFDDEGLLAVYHSTYSHQCPHCHFLLNFLDIETASKESPEASPHHPLFLTLEDAEAYLVKHHHTTFPPGAAHTKIAAIIARNLAEELAPLSVGHRYAIIRTTEDMMNKMFHTTLKSLTRTYDISHAYELFFTQNK